MLRNSMQAVFPFAGVLGQASTNSRCIASSRAPYEDEKGDAGTGEGTSENSGSAGPTGGDSASGPSDQAQEPQSPGEIARQRAAELVAQGYTPRQAAWMSPDPDMARLPRLTRKEAGSYGRPDMVSQYVKELSQGMQLPKNVSLYNLDSAMPEILEPRCGPFDAMVAMMEQNPEMTVEDAARSIGMSVVDIDAPKADEPHMKWTYRNVLVPMTVGESHPVNSKVTCEFHLRHLQAHYGLTDAGADYVAELCDMRYNQKTGMVRLVSDRFASREENRDELERIVRALVEEAKSKTGVAKASRGKKAAPRKTKKVAAVAES